MSDNNENPALTEAVYYILLSLYTPMHGYGIRQNTELLSNGRVKLAAGTLYGALSTLLEKKWIEPRNDGFGNRKKEYLITKTGKDAVSHELTRLNELLYNGNAIIRGYKNESSHL